MASWDVRAEFDEQTLCLPPRATSFTAVCEACLARQVPSRGYVGATVHGDLPLDASRGLVVCSQGHRIRIVRASPDAALR